MASTRSKRPTPSLSPYEEAIVIAFQAVADNPELDTDMVNALRLMLSGPINYSHIADQCGVTATTLWRWRQLPAFKAALTTAKRSILGNTATKLVLEVDNSIDALTALRDDLEAPANVRLAAAKSIIEYAYSHVESAELASDLAEIKEHIKNANG
jgi:transposase-like protein